MPKGGAECGVRDKYAKPWKGNDESHFQLYTTFSKPGLVSIFYNEDQRSFHNWGLEVGSRNKYGRIREAIDHQINAPVLEIAGNHDGSVYMVCPPDPHSTINVDMPYVTLLMKDMAGYSSVEFTACVNLDDTLRNAFGTKLVHVQRIKVNANVRVRRIYFHDEMVPFRSLPQEFRIKLTLTPQEKKEIHMYEEFLFSEPTASPERNIPWSMPRLVITKPSSISKELRLYTPYVLHKNNRKRVEILEVPLKEDDPDKYTSIDGVGAPSNSGLLREMLHKSIPPSKILLPTLSLIYPDKKGYEEAAAVQTDKVNEYLTKKGHKEGEYFKRESSTNKCARGTIGGDEKTELLRRMKKCIETEPKAELQDENGNSLQGQTDWDRFHAHRHSEYDSTEHHDTGNNAGSAHRSEHEHHHHHHHSHGCGKYTVTDLAQYLKLRETFGDYDMFNTKVGNMKFLTVPARETIEDISESVYTSDEENQEEESVEDDKNHVTENPFVLHQRSSNPSMRKSTRSSRAISFLLRRSTISRIALQDPAKITEVDPTSKEEFAIHNTESWLLTWAYTGISWSRTREINQKLLNDARTYFASEHENRKKSIMEAGLSLQQQSVLQKNQKGQQKLPGMYRSAVPMLPKTMKEELRGTGGYYDIIVDNPTLPIEHY